MVLLPVGKRQHDAINATQYGTTCHWGSAVARILRVGHPFARVEARYSTTLGCAASSGSECSREERETCIGGSSVECVCASLVSRAL